MGPYAPVAAADLLNALPYALAGGLVAVLVTLAIEKWGGVVGGLIGTLPSTIVPYALGVWDPDDVAGFRAALYPVPAGMLLNAGFLYLWRALPARIPAERLGTRLTVMVGLSLLAWAIGALGTVLALGRLRADEQALAILAVSLTAIAAAAGVGACRAGVPAPKGKHKVGVLVLVLRGLLAFVAIGAAVLLKVSGGPLIAGMAAVFPAIFLTTMVALWLAQGEAVPAGAVGPMMLGSTSVSAFALLAALAIPAAGPAVGGLLAWIGAALLITVPANLWLRRRHPGRVASSPSGGHHEAPTPRSPS